jgi:mannose-6-phosphate isomerase-like protein (cupin superfamily)
MITTSTPKLELLATTQDGNPEHRVNVAFPLNALTGNADSAVVYLEIPPGHELATHTDSAEEILYIAQGEGEAEVGDERARVSAGDMAVVPAMVPHGLRNVGDVTLKAVGFFSEAKIVSEFAAPLQPLGTATATQGIEAPAEVTA